jgi:phosphohistidine phosphatase
MELYFIRHGIAADRSQYPRDEDRPLTDEGREKTRKVAKRLYDLNVRLDGILTSPLVRAQQTAEILKQESLSQQIEVFPPLAPGGEINTWVNWYDQWRYNGEKTDLALVGHQPDLGNWAEVLLWGSAKDKFLLKKAGVIGLKLPEVGDPVARCELFLFTSPKWLL